MISKAKKYKYPNQLLTKFEEWKYKVLNETVEIEVPILNRNTGEALKMNKPHPCTIENFLEYAGLTETGLNIVIKEVDQNNKFKYLDKLVKQVIELREQIRDLRGEAGAGKQLTNDQTNKAHQLQLQVNRLIDKLNVNELEYIKESRLDENGGVLTFFSVARYVKHFVISTLLDRQQLGIVSDAATKFYAVNNSRYQDVSRIEHIEERKPLPNWLNAGKPTVAIDQSQNQNQNRIGGESIDFTEQ